MTTLDPRIDDYIANSAALAQPILIAALEDKPGASGHFQAFSPSAKREYVEWLLDAKTEATRLRRPEQAVEWIAEGKQRNWKYMNC